jgi:hypothetical protein
MTIMHINDTGINLDLKYFGFATKMDNMLLIANLLQKVKIMFTILGETFTKYLLYFAQ